jgi:hypothetical protein
MVIFWMIFGSGFWRAKKPFKNRIGLFSTAKLDRFIIKHFYDHFINKTV